jgi:hypothetical protein
MAAPTTGVQICNLALARIGQAPISSLDSPESSVEEFLAVQYPQTRQAALREYVFSFARRLAILPPTGDIVPAFGYSAAYHKPTDFIRFLGLGDTSFQNGDIPAHLVRLSEVYIFTDYGDSDGLKADFIYDNDNVGQWDPLFKEVVVLRLAKALAPKYAVKPSLLAEIKDDLRMAERAASAAAGQESPPRLVQRSPVLSVRRRGMGRDNTRITF